MADPDDEFDDFYREHFGRLAGALRLVCGDQTGAEDLAQEAFVRACLAWNRVRTMDRPGGWLDRTAFNLLRRQWRLRRHLQPAGHREDVALDHADAVADRADVGHALRGLPLEQRAAVVARYVLGFSTEEAAEMLHKSQGALRAQLHRAVASLRASARLREGEVLDG